MDEALLIHAISLSVEIHNCLLCSQFASMTDDKKLRAKAVDGGTIAPDLVPQCARYNGKVKIDDAFTHVNCTHTELAETVR